MGKQTIIAGSVRCAIPVLVYEDIPAAHDYLVRVFAFGAGRVDRDDQGRAVHGEIQTAEGVIYLHRVAPEFGVASPASLGADTAGVDVIVDDVEAHYARAKAEGATIVYPPADMPYGVREYGARDLEGRLWSFMAPLDGEPHDEPSLTPSTTTEEIVALPVWPQRTIAVLVTLGDGPHAIPVSAPLRAGDRWILLTLHRTRGSLSRLRERPEVALAVLTAGNIAFTARGRARIEQEQMAAAPDYAAVAIDVTQIDDHRQEAFVVESGVDRRWVDERERDALGERLRALAELASSTSGPMLRPAAEADVPRLTALARAAYGRYVERLGEAPRPMTDDYADVIRRYQVIVAERSGDIVGLIVLGVTGEGFVIDNVAVDPSHQGTGVGRVLLEHAEVTARRGGFDSIYLYTHEGMKENLALYSRIGYVEYERRLHDKARLVYMRKGLD